MESNQARTPRQGPGPESDYPARHPTAGGGRGRAPR